MAFSVVVARQLPWCLGHLIASRILPTHSIHRIRVMSLAVESHEETIEPILDALALIKRLDPRRFVRVETNISWVVRSRLPHLADYRRLCKVCAVDIDRLAIKDDYDRMVKELACTIVHEATHGRLHSLLIPQLRATRARIEKICIK